MESRLKQAGRIASKLVMLFCFFFTFYTIGHLLFPEEGETAQSFFNQLTSYGYYLRILFFTFAMFATTYWFDKRAEKTAASATA